MKFQKRSKSIKKIKNYYNVMLDNEVTINSKKIILCAGTFSKDIIKPAGINILDL